MTGIQIRPWRVTEHLGSSTPTPVPIKWETTADLDGIAGKIGFLHLQIELNHNSFSAVAAFWNHKTSYHDGYKRIHVIDNMQTIELAKSAIESWVSANSAVPR